MAKQLIDVGVNLNDGTGDNLRTAGQKINSMMSEIYSTFGNGTVLTATINGLQHVGDDGSPQLGGLLDLNGYGIDGVGEIFTSGRIATGSYLEVGDYAQVNSLRVTNSGQVHGALTIDGVTTGTVGNFTTSVTTRTLNATTQLQVIGPASVSEAITVQGAGSKVRFWYTDQTAFPVSNTWLGGLSYSKTDRKIYLAVENPDVNHVTPNTSTWKSIALEDSPAFSGTPTAPTAVTSTNSTQIATTEYVQAHRTAINTALDLKAPIAAPQFTGDARAETREKTDNDTSIATTAFVHAVAADYAPLDSPTLVGTPRAPTPSPADDNSTQIATTAFVAGRESVINNALTYKAPTASPEFSGTPTAPTPAADSNGTRIATTAYVTTNIGTAVSNVNTALDLKAPLASPTFTGTPKSVTPTAGDNTTNIATTAFVKSELDTAVTNLSMSDYAKKASPALSGTPTAPTATAGDSSTQIATTAFVGTAITNGSALKWGGSRKFVSTSAPTNEGSDGDIWFQIEA